VGSKRRLWRIKERLGPWKGGFRPPRWASGDSKGLQGFQELGFHQAGGQSPLGFPRAAFYSQCSLICFWMLWAQELNAHGGSLDTDTGTDRDKGVGTGTGTRTGRGRGVGDGLCILLSWFFLPNGYGHLGPRVGRDSSIWCCCVQGQQRCFA